MSTSTKRYRELMTMGIQATCQKCGHVETHICPKATGWSPSVWEMNCVACYRVNLAFDAYRPEHKSVTRQLREAFDDFLTASKLDELDARINELARCFDPLIENRECECGAVFSIAAKPRCKQCGEIIFDSYFHYA